MGASSRQTPVMIFFIPLRPVGNSVACVAIRRLDTADVHAEARSD